MCTWVGGGVLPLYGTIHLAFFLRLNDVNFVLMHIIESVTAASSCINIIDHTRSLHAESMLFAWATGVPIETLLIEHSGYARAAVVCQTAEVLGGLKRARESKGQNHPDKVVAGKKKKVGHYMMILLCVPSLRMARHPTRARASWLDMKFEYAPFCSLTPCVYSSIVYLCICRLVARPPGVP